MTLDARAEDTLDVLTRRGFAAAEVYAKKGRSRIFLFGDGDRSAFRQEEGWAVRAGDAESAFFQAGAGAPNPDSHWPELRPGGLELPPAQIPPPWTPAPDFEAPLITEGEARVFLEALARELAHELPEARIVRGRLEDGIAQAQILSSREVRQTCRHRLASLTVEAQLAGGASVLAEFAGRRADRFDAPGISRRLANRLFVAARGSAKMRDRADMLLAPEVMAPLLGALAHLFLGPGQEEARAAVFPRSPILGSRTFTLIDNGRLPGGLFEAPVDGEGTPTREVVLVDRGVFAQPLLGWHQPQGKAALTGCLLRPGWRDWPRPSFSHLYLQPDPALRVGSLLADLPRGYYLIGATGSPRLEAKNQRFALPVEGFEIDGGRAQGPVGQCWLTGSFTTLFTGIVAAARDLGFQPIRSQLIGAPTLLVRGLELRRHH